MIYQVDQQQLILAVATELKNHIEMPDWAIYAKTGSHRETLPRNPDWWYIRAASILRVCYKEGPVGVSKLRTRYGGRKNRGMAPDKFALAGGKVIRTILQQLEHAELLKQHVVQKHKGRIATPAGTALLAKAAKSVSKKQEAEDVAKKATAKANEKPVKTEKANDKPAAEKKPAKEAPVADNANAEKKSEKQTAEKQTPDTNADSQDADKGAK
jgi:small subunit ribosomal protein S19e